MSDPMFRFVEKVHRRLGLRPTDQLLDQTRGLRIGAHILTPRRAYTHHGIYVGEGRVVQYGGGLRRGPVEEVSLSQFARGRGIWLRWEGPGSFNLEEVIRRARSRLGEDRYHPLRNNCEHFCEWCVYGKPRSYQVDERIAHCLRAWKALRELLDLARARASRLVGAANQQAQSHLHLSSLSESWTH
jgi:hypothetical protein